MTGGRKSRDKGNRTERLLVNRLQANGFAAQRIPLSGAAGGKFVGDITVPLLGIDRRAEVKCRAHGFAQLYGWLADHDFLIVRADRREPLVVIPLELAIEIAKKARQQGSEKPAGDSSAGPCVKSTETDHYKSADYKRRGYDNERCVTWGHCPTVAHGASPQFSETLATAKSSFRRLD